MPDPNVNRSHDRIIYVDPQNIYGKINGVPVTPDYTDYCISVDLEVETYSRLRNGYEAIVDKSSNSGIKYHISFQTREGDKEKVMWASLMTGSKLSDKKDANSYLTTYYTDINYNDFKDHDIIEGLGIESINITFESYYTPTVKIKFIDVRGASLFGRDESVHNHESITTDTIWGAFFTFPYPKFKLQVKGFYGRAVTYQLTCLDFRGSLNAQTGNFEIDTTFIGYDYGLLADIPMVYLIAAPFCSYVGNAYWGEHQYSERWKLSNGLSPITLKELGVYIQNVVDTSIDNDGDIGGIIKDNTLHVRIIKEEEKLNEFLTEIDHLEESFKTSGLVDDEGTNIYSSDSKSECEKILNKLYKFFDEYLEEFGSISYNKLAMFERDFLFNIHYDKWLSECRDMPDVLHKADISGGEIGSGHKIIGKGKKFKDYYILLYEGKKEITIRLQQLEVMRKKNEEDVDLTEYNKAINSDIVELLKTEPNIGNIFKIVMCHLETFLAIMYSAKKEIDLEINENRRMMGQMGIQNYKMTDLALGETTAEINLPPWPGVYTENTADENKTEYAWIGNLNSKREWVEQKVVNALALAAREAGLTSDDNHDNGASMPMAKFPITSTDFHWDTPQVFALADEGNTAAWLAMRASTIFGVCGVNDQYAKVLGKIDALNYYQEIQGIENIKSKLLNKLGTDTLDRHIKKITINPDQDNPPSFQFQPGRRRQPMFTSHNKQLTYQYTKTSDNQGIIPINLIKSWPDTLSANFNKDWEYKNNSIQVGLKSDNDGRPVTSIVYNDNTSSILQISGLQQIEDNDNGGFTNVNMFDVITTDTNVADMDKKVMELKNFNGHTEDDKQKITSFLNKYWKDNSVNDYYQYTGIPYKFLHTYSEFGLNEKNLLPDVTQYEDLYKETYDKCMRIANGSESNPSDTTPVEDIAAIDSKYVLCPAIFMDHFFCNLFTTKFYYQQHMRTEHNSITYKKVPVLDGKKAYLFLLTLPYSNKKPDFIKETKHLDIEKLPYGLVLKLGAIEWRHRFMKKYGPGDLIYNPEEFKQITLDSSNGNEEVHATQINDSNIFVGACLKKSSELKYLRYNDFIDDNVDYTTKNRLIELFANFVNNEWQRIKLGCEIGEKLTTVDFENKARELTFGTNVDNVLPNTSSRYGFLSREYLVTEYPGYTPDNLYGFLSEENPAQTELKDVYSRPVYVIQAHASTKMGASITISEKAYGEYLQGFSDMINGIVNKTVDTTAITSNELTENAEDEQYMDIRLAMYIHLKAIWDKWLSGAKENQYNIENYFYKNFIFIDNRYENIRYKLKVNCEKLLNSLKGINGEATLFKFLSDITTDNNCMFFALPDFISFNGNDEEDINIMRDLFRPLPFTKKGDLSCDNKFIVMYTNPPSQILSEQNNYAYDSFDLYSVDGGLGVVPDSFNHPCIDEKTDKTSNITVANTRYGYMMPAFGVAFGSQNNHIFKDIKVGMHNPIQTDQSINAMSMVAQKGGNSDKRVVFYGQDLFPLYTGYSYSCDLEMMGNAQITPLMYFQLTNVPMFRGAYMIYNVSHTITPGNMTTMVRAMKMSKYSMPWTNRYFSESIGGYFDDLGNYHNNKECDTIEGSTPWLEVAQNEMGTKEIGKNGGPEILKYQQSYKNHGTGEAWCGQFVNWCLTQCGIMGARGGSVASNWANWGIKLNKPATGAIALVHTDPKTSKDKINHVGFVHGITRDGKVVVLGGNQGDMVKDSTYSSDPYHIIGYVFPEGYKPDYKLTRMDKINANLKTT